MRAKLALVMRNPSGILIVLLLLTVGLGGCAGTRLESAHPLIVEAGEPRSAKVYFIRPHTERYMGAADNVITVDADDARLVTLVKGEYTLAHLKPGNVFLTVRTDTLHGASLFMKETLMTQEFTFEEGETYFVSFIPFDGEWRGVHFIMENIDLHRARELTRHMRVIGPARSEPIAAL